MKHILYTVTGALFYWLITLPVSLLFQSVCPPEHASTHPGCLTFYAIIWTIAIIGIVSGLSIKEFHRCGKWFWTKLIPAWASA